MSATVENVPLWANSLRVRPNDPQAAERDRLRVTLLAFRTKIAFLASQIQKAFPNLTVHDITHLDALWETADLIAGSNYPLNPMEAFVFGGAVLLHDAALCFEAYDGGVDGVRNTIQWRDAFAAEKEKHPNVAEVELIAASDFAAIRLLHAKQAATLVDKAWIDSGIDQPIFLLDDFDLRKRYGPIIGTIASSHHWTIEEVASKLPNQINASGDWPGDWRIPPTRRKRLIKCPLTRGALFDGDDGAALVDIDHRGHVEPGGLLQQLQIAAALGLDVGQADQEEAVGDFCGERRQRRGACLQSRELLRFARKRNLEIRPRQNNPTGKSPKTLSSPFEKNIPLNPSGKSSL